MKVKELIKKLKTLDPEAIVVVDAYHGVDVTKEVKTVKNYAQGEGIEENFFCKNQNLFKPNKVCKVPVVYLSEQD